MTSRQQLFDKRDGVEVILDGSKYFWQSRTILNILIAVHNSFSCIELALYDSEKQEEFPRIYARYSIVAAKIDNRELELKLAAKKEIMLRQKKGFDPKDLEHSVLNGMIADYIVNRISMLRESDRTSSSTNPVSLKPKSDCETVRDEFTAVASLDSVCEKPELLAPLIVRRPETKSEHVAADVVREFNELANKIRDDTEAVNHACDNASRLTDLAMTFLNDFRKKAAIKAKIMAQYSSPRKRWVQAIEHVLVDNYLDTVRARLETSTPNAASDRTVPSTADARSTLLHPSFFERQHSEIQNIADPSNRRTVRRQRSRTFPSDGGSNDVSAECSAGDHLLGSCRPAPIAGGGLANNARPVSLGRQVVLQKPTTADHLPLLSPTVASALIPLKTQQPLFARDSKAAVGSSYDNRQDRPRALLSHAQQQHQHHERITRTTTYCESDDSYMDEDDLLLPAVGAQVPCLDDDDTSCTSQSTRSSVASIEPFCFPKSTTPCPAFSIFSNHVKFEEGLFPLPLLSAASDAKALDPATMLLFVTDHLARRTTTATTTASTATAEASAGSREQQAHALSKPPTLTPHVQTHPEMPLYRSVSTPIHTTAGTNLSLPSATSTEEAADAGSEVLHRSNHHKQQPNPTNAPGILFRASSLTRLQAPTTASLRHAQEIAEDRRAATGGGEKVSHSRRSKSVHKKRRNETSIGRLPHRTGGDQTKKDHGAGTYAHEGHASISRGSSHHSNPDVGHDRNGTTSSNLGRTDGNSSSSSSSIRNTVHLPSLPRSLSVRTKAKTHTGTTAMDPPERDFAAALLSHVNDGNPKSSKPTTSNA